MFIITGGGSGIGKALALALAKRNKEVLIVGRREELLKDTASASPLIQYLCADVSDPESLKAIKDKVAHLPQIHGLINNAGTISPIVALKDINSDAWHHAFKTNLDAALFLPQKLDHLLINGRVLNIGSGAAYFPIQGWSAYCVSKAALSMLTRCWQLESTSIAFASVMPGIIDTDMQAIARSNDGMDKDRAGFYTRLKQENRLISPSTVAEFLTWLLLDVDSKTYISQEWDIYDTAHHSAWLRAPNQVLHWDF